LGFLVNHPETARLAPTYHYIFTYTWQCNNKYHGKPGGKNENHQWFLGLHDAMGRSDPRVTDASCPTDGAVSELDTMKKILDSIKTWLEMLGRARAAAYLARYGNYRAAQNLYRD